MATEKDIVLIYFEDKPMSYARIEEIKPDSKPDWYHVKLMLLLVPLQVVTWILRDIYINGEEFTMNSQKMRLELITCPEEFITPDLPEPGEDSPEKESNAKVISFSDRKKDENKK